MRTDSSNLTTGAATSSSPSGETQAKRSRFARAFPWLVRGLVFGTSVAVASYSWWLIPPYLALMAFLLLEPAGRRVNATNPTEAGTTAANATANRLAEVSNLVDDASSDPVETTAEASAEGSTAVKTRRASKARTRKVRQAPEPVPAAWIQVAPGKFVRVEPGTEIPRDEPTSTTTTGEGTSEPLAAEVAPEPSEDASASQNADEAQGVSERSGESPLPEEMATSAGETLADALPEPDAASPETINSPTDGADLPVDSVDPSPPADSLIEAAAEVEDEPESPAGVLEDNQAWTNESDVAGDEPAAPEEFAAPVAMESSEPDEFEEVSAHTAVADEEYEAYDEETGDEPVESELVEDSVEPALESVDSAEEEFVAESAEESGEVTEDDEYDETDAEDSAEVSEFHDEADASHQDSWQENEIDEEAEVDPSEYDAEPVLDDAHVAYNPGRAFPPSRGNVRSGRAHSLPSGFRRRSPRGVGRQRQLIRAFPPRSPP